MTVVASLEGFQPQQIMCDLKWNQTKECMSTRSALSHRSTVSVYGTSCSMSVATVLERQRRSMGRLCIYHFN